MKYLSCDIKKIVPLNSSKASSKVSIESISRWLVGSSNINKLISSYKSIESFNLILSPPDKALTFLNTLLPKNINLDKYSLACPSNIEISSLKAWITVYSSLSKVITCGK